MVGVKRLKTTLSGRRITISLAQLILAAMVVAGLVPLVLLSIAALAQYESASDQATEAATRALDAKSIAFLESRTSLLADEVSSFLDERVKDVRTLQGMPPTAAGYLSFYQSSRREIWYSDGTTSAPVEKREVVPIYRELAFVGADGWEKLRVVDGRVVAQSELRNVADPASTTYKTETYFAETSALPETEVYVSRLAAFHTSIPAQPAGRLGPDAATGADYGRYEGVYRLAAPLRDQNKQLIGIVVLSLDHRHVMDFVVHVLPTSSRTEVVWPNFSTGNYAAMFDDEGYLIVHPLLSRLRGLDASGQMITPVAPSMSDQERRLHPYNIRFVGDTAMIQTFAEVMARRSFTEIHVSTSGVPRAGFSAPILMPRGVKSATGVFGGLLIGASVEDFHLAATTVRGTIQAEEQRLRSSLLGISILAVIILGGTAWLIASWIINPIVRLTDAARMMEHGELDLGTLDALLRRRVIDEVTKLAQVFKQMAEQVQLRERRLKEQIAVLHIQIDEQDKQQQISEITSSDFFQSLQENAKRMRARQTGRRETPAPVEPGETPARGGK
jgi:HAMP domain-containing protein